MIKYLGSKRVLAPRILAAIGALPGVRTVLDLFSGTSRIGHACKRAGYRVLANDHNAYAATLARCYVQADRDELAATASGLLADYARLPGEPGWFTQTYCESARYLQPKNGARVEAIRAAIARAGHPPELEAVLLVALMEAADRVDSTTGVQMAYLKGWAKRSERDLELRLPELLPRAAHGKGMAFELDAVDAVQQLDGDVAYLDPPYNQHKYLGNYHVWESLVRWDRPAVFGIAQKRVDCKTRRSAFNSVVHARAALQRVIAGARARHLVVSFSDEGHFRPNEVVAMLRTRGFVWQLACDHPRYIGARIGIYSPRGEKVGTVSHVRNREFLFVVSGDRAVGRRLGAQGFAMSRAAKVVPVANAAAIDVVASANASTAEAVAAMEFRNEASPVVAAVAAPLDAAVPADANGTAVRARGRRVREREARRPAARKQIARKRTAGKQVVGKQAAGKRVVRKPARRARASRKPDTRRPARASGRAASGSKSPAKPPSSRARKKPR